EVFLLSGREGRPCPAVSQRMLLVRAYPALWADGVHTVDEYSHLITRRALCASRAAADCPGRRWIREGGVAHLEPLGAGCRKGEQRHDDYYRAFIARARAQPRDGLASCVRSH